MHLSARARTAAAIAVVISLTVFIPVHAGLLTWDWSWSGNDNGNGMLTTNPLSGGSYLITSMSGTWDGNAITGLLPLNTCCGSPANDNLLLAGSPQLDLGGLGFSIPGDEINLYSGDGSYYDLHANGSYFSGTFSANQTSTPEPGSLALFGAALGILALTTGVTMRRRRKAASGPRAEG